MASARVRSSLPFLTARRVNSPRSASRSPSIRPRFSSIASTIARPPWTWNSATSSPVKLAGPSNQRARPSSIISFSKPMMVRKAAVRCAGASVPVRISTARRAAGPDTRRTAIPARPGAVASAKIVSFMRSARRSVRRFARARDTAGAVPDEALELLHTLAAERDPGLHRGLRVFHHRLHPLAHFGDELIVQLGHVGQAHEAARLLRRHVDFDVHLHRNILILNACEARTVHARSYGLFATH